VPLDPKLEPDPEEISIGLLTGLPGVAFLLALPTDGEPMALFQAASFFSLSI
jgi:hypothetical protein